MFTRRVFYGTALTLASMGSFAALVNCLSDPRDGESVVTIDSCDVSKLSADPTNPQASLRAYLDTSALLLTTATAAEAELKDACNALGADLGLPPGTDALSACKGIGAYGENLIKKGQPPFGPGAPEWAEIRYVPNCEAPKGALEQCVSACAGPCDATKCEPAKTAGKCQGDCNGQCVTKGDAVPCVGQCVGEAALAGPPTTCRGQCTGVCTNPVWSAACNGACAGFFTGTCAGTCTGQCNGSPINVQDAGPPPDPDAGAAEAGGGGGGPPPLVPPPTNADGNCQGFCVGVCSKGSDGFCANAPCFDIPAAGPPALAKFDGYCADLCGGGTCRAAYGTGSTTTCTGECTASKKACDGVCRGECAGTRTDVTCEGSLKCGQNAECENACQAKVAVATAAACVEPKTIEAYAVSDAKLAAAWQKHGPRLGKALTRLPYLRNAFGFIGARAYGDFNAIGIQGDLVRACVAKGNADVAAAQAKFTAAVAADPSVRKPQTK